MSHLETQGNELSKEDKYLGLENGNVNYKQQNLKRSDTKGWLMNCEKNSVSSHEKYRFKSYRDESRAEKER